MPDKPPPGPRCTNQITQCERMIRIFMKRSRDANNMASGDDDIFVKSLEYAAKKLKFSSYKELQSKAIRSALNGEDVFVNLPTGYGKSAIFQAIPLCKDYVRRTLANTCSSTGATASTTFQTTAQPHAIEVIISPLISLMKDQVNSLKKLGLQAVYFGDATPAEVALMKAGSMQYVFMSPESAFEQGFAIFQLQTWQENLCTLVVDESHCVIKWGQDSKKVRAFRACYGRLSELRSVVPSSVPIISLTATSSVKLRSQLIDTMGLQHPNIVMQSPDRPNVRYSVIKTSLGEDPEIFASLIEELGKLKQNTPRTIIFCRTHNQCRMLYSFFASRLGSEDRYFAMYHSTTEDKVKDEILHSVSDPGGWVRILFCTIAFGMGIDGKNITRIFHFGPSQDLDDYVQESGRGGRGGEACHAVMISYSGCRKHKCSEEMRAYLDNNSNCRRQTLLHAFGVDPEVQLLQHMCCDICARNCKCGGDSCAESPFMYVSIEIDEKRKLGRVRCRHTSDEDKRHLHAELISLRESSMHYEGSLYSGRAFASALSFETIDNIVEDIDFIGSCDILQARHNYFTDTSVLWEAIVATVGPPSEVIQQNLEVLEDMPIDREDVDDPPEEDLDLRGYLLYSDSD